VTPRNRFQHPNAIDPVYGETGRFFASDPDTDTPVANTVMGNLLLLDTGPLTTNPEILEWTRYQGFLVATAQSSEITFQSIKTGAGGNDFYMDNIEFCLMAPDLDADGVSDVEDADSDNDGIPDAIEGITWIQIKTV